MWYWWNLPSLHDTSILIAWFVADWGWSWVQASTPTTLETKPVWKENQEPLSTQWVGSEQLCDKPTLSPGWHWSPTKSQPSPSCLHSVSVCLRDFVGLMSLEAKHHTGKELSCPCSPGGPSRSIWDRQESAGFCHSSFIQSQSWSGCFTSKSLKIVYGSGECCQMKEVSQALARFTEAQRTIKNLLPSQEGFSQLGIKRIYPQTIEMAQWILGLGWGWHSLSSDVY